MRFLPEFINDLSVPEPQLTLEKVASHAQLSLSYLLLLIASSVVCTLGLLLNVSTVVIGGMIISPLMWPLVKASLGITYEVKTYIRHALVLLLVSALIGLLSAVFITFISPLKLINEEILARTNPTLIDIFIAIAAGLVAALSLSKEKISDTLAGVAIATSLMPPLCAAGIGLALFNSTVFFGSFFLFLINVISITFVATLTFLFLGLKKREDSALKYKGVFVVAGLLVLVAVPLFFLLQNYSFQLNSFQRVSSVLDRNLKEISPQIYVENVETRLEDLSLSAAVRIEADVVVPEGITIDFQTQRAIVRNLEESLERTVDLSLRVQRSISVVSEEEKAIGERRDVLIGRFQEEIMVTSPSLTVDSLAVEFINGAWEIDAVLRGDPNVLFTQEEREKIEESLRSLVDQELVLNIDVVPLVQLKSAPELTTELMRKDAERLISGMSSDVTVLSVQVNQFREGAAELVVTVRAPKDYEVPEESVVLFKTFLEKKYLTETIIRLDVIEKNTYEF